jgi:hypothetical protein
MKAAHALLATALLMLMVALGLKGSLLALPGPEAKIAAGAFNTDRAVARLGRVLGDQRPHPVDSAANDAVRERLVAELRALGLQPRITDRLVCNGKPENRSVSCARVRNVTATVGPTRGRHVLLVSHYDSTPSGPGAADDGIGVATMLEVAALLKDRPLRRPVTFLFNEGEEAGLLGARAFLEIDPLATRVDTLVNLESRGVTGPAIMFETDVPNGGAIKAFAASAERPVANSLTTDFARMIPNTTDVAVFAERGWTILNFAIIGNETRYHSPGDTLDALDRGSVRHMGEQALAVTERLASREAPGPAGTRIYADLLGRVLVDMPVTLGLPLLAVLLLLFAWLGWRRRTGLARAAGAVLLALLGSAAVAFVGKWAVGMLRAGEYWRGYPEVIGMAIHLSALLACVLATRWSARPLARDRLRTAYWLVFLTLGAGLSALAPGAAIFFLLPPLLAASGMLAQRWWRHGETAGAIAAWLLLFLSWAPLLHLMETLLDFDAGWMFAPIAAIILLPALVELKPLLARTSRRAVTAGAAIAALLSWTATAAAPAYSEDRKQAFGFEYVWDETAGQARWMVVNDEAPLPAGLRRVAAFTPGATVPWSGRSRWAAPAPQAGIAAPRVELLSSRSAPGGRIVSLRLRSMGSDTISLRTSTPIRAVRAGSSVRRFGSGAAKDDYIVRCHGRSCDGLELEMLLQGSAPAELTLIGNRSGLPAVGQALVAARPALAAPQYWPDATIAIGRARI